MAWISAAALDPNVDTLADTLIERAEAGLGDDPADVAFLFVAREHAPRIARLATRVREGLRGPRLLGCTAGGVLGQGREYERLPAAALLTGRLEAAAVHAFHVREGDLPDADAPPRAWHEALGVSPSDAHAFVVLPDPFSLSANHLLAGLDYAWPGAVTVGGLASGGRRPGDHALLLDDRASREGAVGLAFMGDVEIVPVVAQGCRPIGRTLRVSSCQGNLLRGLDDRPALDALKEAITSCPDDAQEGSGRNLLLGFEMDPFSVGDEGPWLLRPLVGVDRETQGLVVGEPLRRGRRVRFHVRDRATCHEDLDRTLAVARGAVPEPPLAALLFSCMGRGVHLYGEPDHDTQSFQAHFEDVPLAGFFCNGEIGPVGRRTHLHGFTSSFGLLRRPLT